MPRLAGGPHHPGGRRLRRSDCARPWTFPLEVAAAAEDAALRIANELGVTGVMAVELFETPGAGAGFLINELAMRPHNTGHWTQDGSVTSQFEQHLRAVLNLPLGATDVLGPGRGDEELPGRRQPGSVLRLPAGPGREPAAKVHCYGKSVRPGPEDRPRQPGGSCRPTTSTRSGNAPPPWPASSVTAGHRPKPHHGTPRRPHEHRRTASIHAAGADSAAPIVGLVMGSDSDWPVMEAAAEALAEFGIPFEADVVSAHRMPTEMIRYGQTAHERGLRVIIAGAGGAAHLPGHARVRHSAAGHRRPRPAEDPGRHGLPALHRADARRRSGGHRLHRAAPATPACWPSACWPPARTNWRPQLRDDLLDFAQELNDVATRKGASLRQKVSEVFSDGNVVPRGSR